MARTFSRALVAALALLIAVTATAAAAGPGQGKRYPSSLDRVSGASSGGAELPRATALDVEGTKAKRGIPDLGARPRVPRWLRPSAGQLLRGAHHWEGMDVNEQRYEDEHGHVVTLATDNPAVDLQPWANLLVSTYHYGEVELVHVFVTSALGVSQICGEDAVACYSPDDPDRLFTGVMILSYEDTDAVHTLFHEYGHHMDNQLYNLARISSCAYSSDGSRRWFFARDVEDDILDKTGCDDDTPWELLLGELYAEDYAQLSGAGAPAFDSRMPVLAPSEAQLGALESDIDDPFVPSKHTFKGKYKRSRAARYMALDGPSFLQTLTRRGTKRVGVSGCDYEVYLDVFDGICEVGITRKSRARSYAVTIEAY